MPQSRFSELDVLDTTVLITATCILLQARATPLFISCWKGHTAIAALLLAHGASVDVANKASELD